MTQRAKPPTLPKGWSSADIGNVGVSGVAMNTSLMQQVQPHFMGRVQNTFYFFGTLLQVVLGITVGLVASRISLAAGFGVIAIVYAFAFASACWPMKTVPAVVSVAD